jgi:hypothetical protein
MPTLNICVTVPPFPTYDTLYQSVSQAVKSYIPAKFPSYPFINLPPGIISTKPPFLPGLSHLDLEVHHVITEFSSILSGNLTLNVAKAIEHIPGLGSIVDQVLNYPVPFIGVTFGDVINGNVDWNVIEPVIAANYNAICAYLGLPTPIYSRSRNISVEIKHLYNLLISDLTYKINNLIFLPALSVIQAFFKLVNFPPIPIPNKSPTEIATELAAMIPRILVNILVQNLSEQEMEVIYALFIAYSIANGAPQNFSYPLFNASRNFEAELHEMIKHIADAAAAGLLAAIIKWIETVIPIPGVTICIGIPIPDIPSFPNGIPINPITPPQVANKLNFNRGSKILGVITKAEHAALSQVNKQFSVAINAERKALSSVLSPIVGSITKARIAIQQKELQGLQAITKAIAPLVAAESKAFQQINSVIGTAAGAIGTAAGAIGTINALGRSLSNFGKGLGGLAFPSVTISADGVQSLIINGTERIIENKINNFIRNSLTPPKKLRISAFNKFQIGGGKDPFSGLNNALASATKGLQNTLNNTIGAALGTINSIESVASNQINAIGAIPGSINSTVNALSNIVQINISSLTKLPLNMFQHTPITGLLSGLLIPKFPFPTFNSLFKAPIVPPPGFPTLKFIRNKKLEAIIADPNAAFVNSVFKNVNAKRKALQILTGQPRTDYLIQARIALSKLEYAAAVNTNPTGTTINNFTNQLETQLTKILNPVNGGTVTASISR